MMINEEGEEVCEICDQQLCIVCNGCNNDCPGDPDYGICYCNDDLD